MLESVYGKKMSDALNTIVESAQDLTVFFGLDESLAANIRTVRGNSDRLRSLARLEATAALMDSLKTAVMEGGGAKEGEATGVALYTLEEVLAIPGLTKTSKEAITAAFATEEPQEGEEPEG